MWWFSQSSFPHFLWKHLHLFQHTSIQISSSIRYKTSNLHQIWLCQCRGRCTIESLDHLWNLFNTTENWGPMEDPVVDITWINAESLQQRGRKTVAEAALCEPRKKCLLLTSSESAISWFLEWERETKEPSIEQPWHHLLNEGGWWDIHQTPLCNWDLLDWRQRSRILCHISKTLQGYRGFDSFFTHSFLYSFCFCHILAYKKKKLPQL